MAVLPQLAGAGHVVRASTSAGLSDSDTGEPLKGSQGQHIYICVQDGIDAERFLQDLHSRCWLAGFGWLMVGAGGQFLERSIVDRMVGAPERLAFEGAPVLVPPIVQDGEARRGTLGGGVLDTLIACPPLTVIEKARLQEMLAKERARLGGAASAAREEFVRKRGGTASAARMCDGVLLPDVVLPFDDFEFGGAAVGDVLENPARYEGATLADPLEGVSYGRCKAKVMVRADGSPWIYSFAHGRTVYDLRYDAATVRAKVQGAEKDKRLSMFLRYAVRAELAPEDVEALVGELAKQQVTKQANIRRLLKEARTQRRQKRQDYQRDQQRAERRDPRPRIDAPANDAPWLPQVEIVEEALGSTRAAIPPMRDAEGDIVAVRKRSVPGMHGFGRKKPSKGEELPAPEQWLLGKSSEIEVAELIEQHVDYVDADGRSVHLPLAFVKHNVRRHDSKLPVAVAVATLPVMLADGVVLGRMAGLDRERGIVFNIAPELMALVPRREDCTQSAVAEAMRFLTDKWLVDVLTDYEGKCIMIAAALSIIQRTQLAQRPTFMYSAGRRATGKTTAIEMIIHAVSGIAASAATWSHNKEERRKSLHAFYMAGVSYILWDNIDRGTQVQCPYIEKACTSEYTSDRKLGVSEQVEAPATAIHLFNGNNITTRGDMTSRCLQIRLDTDRADPENREFAHADPIAWTCANRARILRSLYTILLGNPHLAEAEAPTRFKVWWRLVGSAVEHAASAALGREEVSFMAIFERQEAGNEDDVGLAEFLEALLGTIERKMANRPPPAVAQAMGGGSGRPDVLTGAEITNIVNDMMQNIGGYDVVRQFLWPEGGLEYAPTTANVIGKRLAVHLDNPVPAGGRTLILRKLDAVKPTMFKVEVRK